MMMQCGHDSQGVYQATKDSPEIPACVICLDSKTLDWCTPAPLPDLAGRLAKCSCGNTAPSDPDKLAFFEYRGPGSKIAARACRDCGFYAEAHKSGFWNKSKSSPRFHAFKAHGAYDTDVYYCGCRGWD